MDRRDFLKNCFVGLAGFGAVGSFSSCRSGLYGNSYSKKPNVLLIMADDMGYSDLECYGGEVRSPSLSQLAKDGLRFTQHYSTGRCWPSRACILTGYYAQQIRRDSMKGIKMGKRPGWAPLLPEMLKTYGYKSYHSGKWHIDGTPEAGGFDRSWGDEKNGCDWNRYFDSNSWQEGHYAAPVQEGQEYYSTVANTHEDYGHKWELYHIKTDRCEMKNLALKYPEKVKDMSDKWEAIAQDFREGLKIK